MFKKNYFIALLLLGVCIFSLFQVKFKVQYLHHEMLALQEQLEHEKSTIHVLKAEWAYLNQPDRLQRLSDKFLDLIEIKHSQLKFAQAGSMIVDEVGSKSSNKKNNNQLIKVSYQKSSIKPKSKTKWRYRERPVVSSGRKV